MDKLYKLSYCLEGSVSFELSFSHSPDKLMKTVPNDTWIVKNDPNDKTLKYASDEEKFPMYFIREVPLVI